MKTTIQFYLLMVFIPFSGLCSNKTDTTETVTGMNYGFLPVVAFDSDQGFQYGALTNLFWYGDGNFYPKYNHSAYFEASKYTSGTSLLRFYFDSPQLFNQVRFTGDITYLNMLATDFFGFNGYQSVYNNDWRTDDHPLYKSRVFYTHFKSMSRILLNFKGNLFNENKNLQWIAGGTFFHTLIGSTKINPLNKHLSKNDKLPDIDGLYDLYSNWGFISDDEKNGGNNTYLKLGIGYDSRNTEANPSKGVWTECLFSFAPDFLSSQPNHYSQIALIHRQYISILPNKLTFAYRLSFQNRLSGKIPFYLLPHLLSSTLTSATSQGLGGGKTLRGIKRNRIVGEGVAYGNFEFRWKFLQGKLFKQNFYIANNTFIDMGRVTQYYKINIQNIPDTEKENYVRTQNERMHYSFGSGFKFALNENFIVSVDYGKAAYKDDGNSGVYVLMNYLF